MRPKLMVAKQPITTTLVGMNVAVYIVMVLTGVSPVNPTIPQLLKWGANAGPLSLGPEPWRILASTYVHGWNHSHCVEYVVPLEPRFSRGASL